VLSGGTAYITDAGMTGVQDSVIGTRPEIAVKRFVEQVPTRFKPAEGRAVFCGAVVDIDEADGRARGIERLQIAEVQRAPWPPDDEEE
jgi:calcineurin-like phosphoesterase